MYGNLILFIKAGVQILLMFKYIPLAEEQFHTFCKYYHLFIDYIVAEKKKKEVKDRGIQNGSFSIGTK